MVSFSASLLLPPAVSFALALALTPVVRALARRWGFVAKPKVDRWHKKPTAMMGGVGIWLAVSIADLRRTQDCVLMGRRDCVKITTPHI